MLQPEFYECCELWRKRDKSDELEDIFDGVMNTHGVPFLCQPYNFALSIMWIGFKGSVYAAGALYIAILNLPCTERYKSQQHSFTWNHSRPQRNQN